MPVVHTSLIESLDPEGPFGAKEAGQGPLLPVIPAIANAVYNALGVRIDEIPITPEKVLRALAQPSRRVGPKAVPRFAFPSPIQAPRPPEWEGK